VSSIRYNQSLRSLVYLGTKIHTVIEERSDWWDLSDSGYWGVTSLFSEDTLREYFDYEFWVLPLFKFIDKIRKESRE
jgi:hypothetical protein